MRSVILVAGILVAGLVLLAGAPGPAPAADPPPTEAEDADRVLFVETCGRCHGLEIPRGQRLDRATWSWVLEDMEAKYGLRMTEEDQERILEYLVANFGRRGRPFRFDSLW